MFKKLALRGKTGSIVWAYRTVALLEGWTVRRSREDEHKPFEWALEGQLSTEQAIDTFCLRQRPLLFTAPRHRAGFFCWPIRELVVTADTRRVTARLGPPEY